MYAYKCNCVISYAHVQQRKGRLRNNINTTAGCDLVQCVCVHVMFILCHVYVCSFRNYVININGKMQKKKYGEKKTKKYVKYKPRICISQ